MNGVDWRTKIEQAEGRAIREKREMRERLAAAEQRATESEERAERLAEKLIEARAFVMKLERRRDPFASDINDYTHLIQTISDALAGRPDYVPKQRKASGDAPSNPAPATQPDERAAAARALLDRLAKRILAEIVYCAPENRALAEEVARAARIETDLIVARYGDTDGAAKEGT